MNLKDVLGKKIIILDGAMGTSLQKMGLKAGECPETFNILHPELVKEVHSAYAEAGSEIVLTNTFGANRKKLLGTGYTPEEIITAGVKTAKQSGACFVALDIGPIGELLEPMGILSFDEAYDIFAEQITAGKKAGADLIYIETMTDLLEAKAAVLAAKDNCDLPVFCTMSFEENMRTFTGCTISAMALTLEGLGADAIGINCSLGPAEMLPMAKELMKWTDLPVIIKPNAGMPEICNGITSYNVTPSEFSREILKLAEKGAALIGGCCGTTPDFIREVSKNLQKSVVSREKCNKSAVCTPSKTVEIDRVRIIGERINPTGKKLFKEALKKGDINYAVSLAIEEDEAGADILDINVGLPGIDEVSMMTETVKNVQCAVNLPLQIDSSSAEVLKAALKIYNGKPLVNSVNAEEKSLNTILPIVKKYGAAVVGLTLDENGIPKTAEERYSLAEKIVKRAESMGIPKKDIYIDCLTLTSGAEQSIAYETLKAVSMVKEGLGVKTVLGVSNISFGLPERETLNCAFLCMAMAHGLDLAIINPNSEKMTDAVFCYHQLKNIDKGSNEYINRFSGRKEEKNGKTESVNRDISYYIAHGQKEEAGKATEALLSDKDPMDIINKELIPALEKVGKDYENGKIFLPQLLSSAEAAKKGFDVVKKAMSKEKKGEIESKGHIILATVKGDVHDIGKNIVRAVLENYGYEITDLGRDVAPETVLNTCKDGDLIGLSALMTTTVDAMEETIRLVKTSGKKCSVMVGGAVLTEDYAKKINADFYAKDVQAAVLIAGQYFKK